MKEFIKKYRKLVVVSIALWSVLFLLFIVNTSFSITEVNRFVHRLLAKQDSDEPVVNWNNADVQELYKEKLWLENQVALANTNIFSLGLNLSDSLVQVQLKGTILFQAKILYRLPSNFFDSAGEKAYSNYFSGITVIDTSIANIPKKPIKKVTAPPVGSEVEARKPDTVKVDRIHWEFITENQLKVVINGASFADDSAKIDIPVAKDMRSYRFQEGVKNTFSGEYIPTLFLWLNDAEAKAIYRAIPDNADLIFRN